VLACGRSDARTVRSEPGRDGRSPGGRRRLVSRALTARGVRCLPLIAITGVGWTTPYCGRTRLGKGPSDREVAAIVARPDRWIDHVRFNSLYHATKWALEGWSESMAFELNQLGIGMKIVEPGGMKTGFFTRPLDVGTSSL
jgi:NAD(P)-dependent dehydrogenase (short-subunit alcohol dehydrogenase family)